MTGRRYIRHLEAQLAAEQDRSAKLLELLMARAAPAEYGAYLAPPTEEPKEWVWSDDGLVGYSADEIYGLSGFGPQE